MSVHRLSVSHVHTVIVENLAGLEVAFGYSANLDHGAGERLGDRVAEQDDSGDGVVHLKVDEVIRDKERVKRTFTHFVEVQIVLLFGVWMFGEAVDLGDGRPYNVVNDT